MSLLSACSIATSLSWLLQRLGLDPVFGSGPLATVIQDLPSILLYFVITIATVAEGTREAHAGDRRSVTTCAIAHSPDSFRGGAVA